MVFNQISWYAVVKHISDEMKEKLALFCDVEPEAVIENQTCSSIYEVPLMMQDQGLDDIVIKKIRP